MLKRGVLAIATTLLITAGYARAQDSVYFDIQTSTGKDTLYAGVQSALIFNFDPRDEGVVGINFPMEFSYTADQIFGVLGNESIIINPMADSIYKLANGANLNYWDGVASDSLLVFFFASVCPCWADSAELWRMSFVPQTTGSFHFDSILFPPANVWNALDTGGTLLPFEIINYGRTYTVTYLTGDVNTDGVITSADIIYLVNFVFLRGPQPKFCVALGDVNCNASVTSSDIIYLVSYVFKSGESPCDLSTIIPDQLTCP